MSIFQNIINHKVNTITPQELLSYAKQFQVPISEIQATKIANYLRGKNVNIFVDSERIQLIKEITNIAGAQTANAVNQLFLQFKG